MKISLNDKNKRKTVYDILNIFYDDSNIEFTNRASINILDDEIIFKDKSYLYESNYKLKANLYKIFEKETGYKSPWGMLTGSKPSKLLKSQSTNQIKDKYFVSDEKLALLKDVENEQNKLDFNKNDFNLYINIPFCPTRCRYCAYPTLVGINHDRSAYIDKLIYEINNIDLPNSLDSIYIGGGTPTDISAYDLDRLLNTINKRFTYREFTVEAGREDTLDKQKLDILSENKVQRISLNPQTFNEDIINSVGRSFDYDNFITIYEYAKDLEFIINMDFIVGLVGENSCSFIRNFEILEKLKPQNITFHALASKRGSKYREENKKGSVKDALKINEAIKKFTEENGYKAYYLYRQKNILSNLENVGYQRDDTSQRYNIVINEEIENVIGLGMNANTKLMNGKKYRNARNLRDYTENIENIIRDKNMMIESN